MRTGRQPGKFMLCGLAAALLLVSPGVFAYLDPSTGSMVISAIVGIIASIALALKTYWYRIKGFLKRSKKQGSSVQDTESHNPIVQDSEIQNSGQRNPRTPDSPE